MIPLIAIIGRPNVGKSTLFNRLIKKNRAITHDLPGVTRDRIYGKVTWTDYPFELVDTGGLVLGSDQEIEEDIFTQAREAIAEAQVILYIVDGREGATALDEEVASYVRQSNKPVVLAVNKVDGEELAAQLTVDFHRFGFPMVAVSAEHGVNIVALGEALVEAIPNKASWDDEQPEFEGLRLSMLGRPNVGKSSLVNALLGKDRLIVSPVAGTTRDSVDVVVERQGKTYVFLDTAGVRKKAKVHDSLEQFSVIRSLKSSRRAQVVILVLDVLSGIVTQDKKLLAFLDREKIPFIAAFNKIDLLTRSQLAEVKQEMFRQMKISSHVPLIFTSAVTRAGMGGLLPLAEKLWKECQIRVTTGKLNRFIKEVTQKHQPPVVKRRRAKLYYMTQAETAPPTFVVFVNDPKLIKPAYTKYLENQIRKQFGLSMAPVQIYYRSSHKKK